MNITSICTYDYSGLNTNANKIFNKPINFEARFSNGIKKPRHIKPFFAYRDFIRYNPRKIDFGTYEIPVHNPEIARQLQPKYTSKEFESIFEFTKQKGTFDYIMDEKTGFIKTSLINRKENPLMSDLIWITDSCHNMELIKQKDPKSCTEVLNKLAELYDGQQKSFDEIISNPGSYKHNKIWPNENQKGVGHCFIPETKQPHKWYAKTRLESIGNYLQTAADIISGGFNGRKFGYKSAEEIPQVVVNSIANCTKYLKSINYPRARSCGAWEEQTFVNSLTSDTSIINQSMRDVMELMYKPTENKDLIKLRERILESKNGDVFKDKNSLEILLKEGEARIIEQPDMEVTRGDYSKKLKDYEAKAYERGEDSALSFMYQTETLNPKDVYKDSAKKLLLLKKLSNSLVRPNGAIRYRNDEYLNLDYHTLKNHWTDNKKRNEAEWFLVSEISRAYGKIAKNLLDNVNKTGTLSQNAKKLLSIAMNGQTEYINRSYARITPKGMTKSNGYRCPAYRLPEAYEAVSTKIGIKYVPGAHTPLTWAESSLYKASEEYLKNLKNIEKLDLNI